jgi:mRNA interferase MazF
MRPAVVLASGGRGDWILCQVTGNPYGDPRAIQIDDVDFATGGLQRRIYARSAKLFTANASLMVQEVGKLKPDSHRKVIDSVISILRSGE